MTDKEKELKEMLLKVTVILMQVTTKDNERYEEISELADKSLSLLDIKII